jgi:hypothetical protein
MGSFNNHGATGTVLTLDEDRESLMTTLLSKRDASPQWDYYNQEEEEITNVDSGAVAGLYGSRVHHVPSASQEEEETFNQEEEDRNRQEEENMGYFREFKNFFGEAKGAKFDTDFPVPRLTTPPVPVPCLTMAREDGW